MPDTKRRLAEQASKRVKPGASIALDDSTTTLAMLPFLAEIGQLTIVTYFASVIEEVARLAPDTLELIVVGGTYSHKYHSFGGVLAEQQLMGLSVDHSFISVSVGQRRARHVPSGARSGRAQAHAGAHRPRQLAARGRDEVRVQRPAPRRRAVGVPGDLRRRLARAPR